MYSTFEQADHATTRESVKESAWLECWNQQSGIAPFYGCHGPLRIINAHVGNYSWFFHAAHAAGHSKYLRCKSPRRKRNVHCVTRQIFHHSLWLQEGDGHSLLGCFLKWSIECRFDLKHLPFPAGWCPYWVNRSKGNQKKKVWQSFCVFPWPEQFWEEAPPRRLPRWWHVEQCPKPLPDSFLSKSYETICTSLT